MDKSKTILVVPTIRKDSFERFCKLWNHCGLFHHVDVFIVMEDNPTRTFSVQEMNLPCSVIHFCWEDIDTYLGHNSWIIPRRSDTVRSFGYLYAAKTYGDGNVIITLDDDCYPIEEREASSEYGDYFVKQHRLNLSDVNESRWFNTIEYPRPRGIPLYNVGESKSVTILSHGLWENVPDLDAITQLTINTKLTQLKNKQNVVPHGKYFPMCGMNLAWKSEYTVLMYHLLMGRIIDCDFTRPYAELMQCYTDKDLNLTKLNFDRFGDIWCGLVMKKIADTLHVKVTSGYPHVHHDRASNPFVNLQKEAAGMQENEWLWETIDKSLTASSIVPLNARELYKVMGFYFRDTIAQKASNKENCYYFDLLGKAMQVWADQFYV